MRHFIPLIAAVIYCGSMFSQCPDCTPDESCTNDENFPQMCPEILPDGTAGEYFEQNITVWLPPTVTDPDTGVTVDLIEVVMTSITGVPFGIDFVLNSDDNTYYPSDGDEFACATVCGVPIIAGEYEVIIMAHVTTLAFGFEVEVDQPFSMFVTVLPGEGGNSTFTFDNLAGCVPTEVNFEGLINADPQPTTWDWNFGNGNTSQSQFPPTQIFDEPGDFVVNLTTTVYDFVLTDVLLSTLASGWSGDVEELTTLQNPDPYFVITNGSGVDVYTSSTIDDVQSGTWTGLNLILTDPPYSISFYDEDLFSGDDFLGDWDIPYIDGTFIFDADGSTGSLNISLQAGPTFNDEEIISVFPSPNANFTLDDDNNTIFYDDPTLESFVWFFNGDTIPEALESTWTMFAAGIYTCIVTNIYGCSGESDPYTQCPEFTPSYDPETNTLTALGNMTSYQWFFNGLEIDGATADFIVVTEIGNYSVLITTDYGCETMSDMFIFTGIEGIDWIQGAKVYPNPASSVITVTGSLQSGGELELLLIDVVGRVVYKSTILSSGMLNEQIDVSQFDAGMYMVHIVQNSHQKDIQVLIQ
jgi:hypothetical protein